MDEVEKKDEDLMQGSGVSPQPMDETKGLFADSMPQLTGREKGPQAVIKFLRYDNCRLQGIEKEYKKILQELSDKLRKRSKLSHYSVSPIAGRSFTGISMNAI